MLKLSGEALQGGLGFGVDPAVLRTVARDIAECQMRGLQVRAIASAVRAAIPGCGALVLVCGLVAAGC